MVGGALMCINGKVFDSGLDTRLPMYLEDQEICMRARRHGYTAHVHSDLSAVHIGGVSRKSFSKHERALRIMELVEAPVQCMHRLQGYGLFWLRLTVFVGGAARLAAVIPAAVIKVSGMNVPLSDASTWIANQLRLAWWYMIWAVCGTFHTTDISLDDYVQSFDSKTHVQPDMAPAAN
ncbi:hypothetical protein MMUC44124_29190 [Mycolicibacterium mucogenicum DSM 44124]|nr:hypothetical protein MMUC44124_29190 [Mycolicibacterium mucogenicum DSM 44124]